MSAICLVLEKLPNIYLNSNYTSECKLQIKNIQRKQLYKMQTCSRSVQGMTGIVHQ